MKPNTLRNIYIASVNIILYILLFWIGIKFSFWNLKPNSIIIVVILSLIFFLSILIGRFLFMFFSGVNVVRVMFFTSEVILPKQAFRIYLYFGTKKEVIDGSFDNALGINEDDLLLLIYSQTTRHMLRNLIMSGIETDINYTFQNQNIRVTYIVRITNLYFNS